MMDHQKAREKHPSQSAAVYINEGKSGKNLKIIIIKNPLTGQTLGRGRSLGSDWIGLLCEIYRLGFLWTQGLF